MVHDECKPIVDRLLSVKHHISLLKQEPFKNKELIEEKEEDYRQLNKEYNQCVHVQRLKVIHKPVAIEIESIEHHISLLKQEPFKNKELLKEKEEELELLTEHYEDLIYERPPKPIYEPEEIYEPPKPIERLEYIDIDQQTGYDIYYNYNTKRYILKPPPGVTLISEPEYNSLRIVLDYALETDGGGEPIEIEVEAKIPVIVSNMGADDITKLIHAVDEAVKDYFGDKFGKGGAVLSDILYLKSPTKRTSKLGVYIEPTDEVSTVDKGGKCEVQYMVEMKGKYVKREYHFSLDEYIVW